MEHNAVWNLGIHVMPEEITLPPEVREYLPPEIVDSCVQFRGCMLHLLGDIYDNIELYLPLPYQLSRKVLRPLIDLALIGEADGCSLTIDRQAFDRYIKKLSKSTDYEDDRRAGIGIDHRLDLYKRS